MVNGQQQQQSKRTDMFIANNRSIRRHTTATYCMLWSHNLRVMIFEDEERGDSMGDLKTMGVYECLHL